MGLKEFFKKTTDILAAAVVTRQPGETDQQFDQRRDEDRADQILAAITKESPAMSVKFQIVDGGVVALGTDGKAEAKGLGLTKVEALRDMESNFPDGFGDVDDSAEPAAGAAQAEEGEPRSKNPHVARILDEHGLSHAGIEFTAHARMVVDDHLTAKFNAELKKSGMALKVSKKGDLWTMEVFKGDRRMAGIQNLSRFRGIGALRLKLGMKP